MPWKELTCQHHSALMHAHNDDCQNMIIEIHEYLLTLNPVAVTLTGALILACSIYYQLNYNKLIPKRLFMVRILLRFGTYILIWVGIYLTLLGFGFLS